MSNDHNEEIPTTPHDSNNETAEQEVARKRNELL